MSLISQNAGSRNRAKSRKEDNDKPAFMGGNDGNENGRVLDLGILRGKKGMKEKEEQLMVEEGKEMKKLENFLFASLYSPFGEYEEEKVHDEARNSSALFFIDRSAGGALSAYENNEDEEETKKRKAVWVDEEEDNSTVEPLKNRSRKLKEKEDERYLSGHEFEARLRAQHMKMNPGTGWALVDFQHKSHDDESSDEETGTTIAHSYGDAEPMVNLLCSNEDHVVKNRAILSQGLLEFSRLVDANAQVPSNAPITSTQFHPNGQLLLVASLDRMVSFYQIDGKRNTKIEGVFIEDCPIRKACFLPDGSRVIIGGRRKFFYILDLETAQVKKAGPLVGREEKSLEVFDVSPDSSTIAFVGNEGYILLVSSKTNELIGTLKMNGTARSLAFAEDGHQLLSHGGDGQVYLWDLRTRVCIYRGVDEGCIKGTALCTSSNRNLFAAGSDSGIVNVYNKDEFLGGKRKPMKTIENLTTKVDFMKFNHDAQILAIGSHMKKNSLKLIHVPSFTVFSNWPPVNTTLHYPRCLDFSPGGGFMAVGNAAGKVLLYKLHHYDQA